MSGVWIGCLLVAVAVELLAGRNSRVVVPLCCCRTCLLGDEGLWSGETFPSLSLVVDEGGVGGRENPTEEVNIYIKIIYNISLIELRLKHNV